MKPFFRRLGFRGSGVETPMSFPASFPASEDITKSILATPSDFGASDGSALLIADGSYLLIADGSKLLIAGV